MVYYSKFTSITPSSSSSSSSRPSSSIIIIGSRNNKNININNDTQNNVLVLSLTPPTVKCTQQTHRSLFLFILQTSLCLLSFILEGDLDAKNAHLLRGIMMLVFRSWVEGLRQDWEGAHSAVLTGCQYNVLAVRSLWGAVSRYITRQSHICVTTGKVTGTLDSRFDFPPHSQGQYRAGRTPPPNNPRPIWPPLISL